MFQILPSIAFKTVNSHREEKQKSIMSRKSLSLSNISNFWKFIDKFWYQSKQMFLINYQYDKVIYNDKISI